MVATVSDKHKFMFVHIPKTAGTSISTQIHSYPIIHRFNKHVKFLELERYFTKDNNTIKDFFIFTCLRRPEDRLFSHWFGHFSEEYKQYVKKGEIDISTINKSFKRWMKSDYVDLIEDSVEYKIVKNPACEWLKGKSGRVSMGKFNFLIFENLSDEWPSFVTKFRKHVRNITNKKKCEFIIKDDLPKINVRASELYRKDNIRKLYDGESWEIFEKHNSKDIELYNKVRYENKLKRKKLKKK